MVSARSEPRNERREREGFELDTPPRGEIPHLTRHTHYGGSDGEEKEKKGKEKYIVVYTLRAKQPRRRTCARREPQPEVQKGSSSRILSA